MGLPDTLKRVVGNVVGNPSFSQTATLTHRANPKVVGGGGANYDPTTGQLASPTVPETVRIVWVDATGRESVGGANAAKGTPGQPNTRDVLMAASGLASPPRQRDELKVDGQVWHIHEVDEIRLGGTVLAYPIRVAR